MWSSTCQCPPWQRQPCWPVLASEPFTGVVGVVCVVCVGGVVVVCGVGVVVVGLVCVWGVGCVCMCVGVGVFQTINVSCNCTVSCLLDSVRSH